ncbi:MULTISPECIES: endonuclease MutS2 [unclassified Granulicatella]|jgi:mutS2 family protein|uniref:endonuclease MutS2 n=1 Tax=unclassified Granulicatella TaxID=2630493 RepID=UPI00066CC0D3|nr:MULTISPECIES: endonuclease MutS2 [unclassified Granulicatella]OFT01292.1 endonuclease MutS2 [Granulicatella sp. HMSC31F03]
MNSKIEKVLEFDKIRAQLAEYATSEKGKQMIKELPIEVEEKAIQHKIEETADGVELLRLKQGIPIPRLKDISFALKRLELEAGLNGRELSDILRVLTTTHEVERFFEKVEEEEIALKRIPRLVEKLESIPDVTKELEASIREDGYVLDSASPTLHGIRVGIQKTEQEIRRQMDQYLTGKNAQYLSDTIITIRNDRYVLPVKAEYKSVFGGTVHDQSATGQTLFMEPQAVVNLNNKLREYQVQEKREVERILWELSQKLMPYTNSLHQNHYVLARLDVVNAKALYANEIKATEPIIDRQNHVALWKAWHPLLDREKAVANDIILGEEYQAIVITGPNTGGKTILLKTVGVIQLMAQMGLYIPAGENSRVGIFTEIFADIGDEQSIEQNLSTFSSHMSNIVSILKQINNKSLLLIDEIGSGTDPQEGSSLAIAILDYIASKQSYVIASTHYPELKAYGYDRPKTINASMEFDGDTLQPTYQLLLGVPGRSNAFDISKRLGLPSIIIDQARGLLSEEDQDLNAMISDLEQKRRRAQRDADKMRHQLELSTQLLEDLQKETELFKANKARLLEEAKERANSLIEQSKDDADKILSEIRELQLRSKQSTVKEHEMIEKKTALTDLKHEQALKKNKVLRKEKAKKALQVGQSVEVLSFGQRGTLVEKVSDEEWVVQMGIIKMKIAIEDLAPIAETQEAKQQVIVKSARSSHVSSELDLRGKRYEEAMKDLDLYIDAAILANYPRVTIIHGRGTGAIQQGVHKTLRSHRSVASFEFAPMNTGGNGATIVTFK